MLEHPLTKYSCLIFDADGTLRECTVPGQPCPNKDGEWILRQNVQEVMALYDPQRYCFGVASNQSGVALGCLTDEMAKKLLVDTAKAAFPLGSKISVRYCGHLIIDNCYCRKPWPLMLHRIITIFNKNYDEVLFVGDRASDKLAAENCKIDFMFAKDFFAW